MMGYREDRGGAAAVSGRADSAPGRTWGKSAKTPGKATLPVTPPVGNGQVLTSEAGANPAPISSRLDGVAA